MTATEFDIGTNQGASDRERIEVLEKEVKMLRRCLKYHYEIEEFRKKWFLDNGLIRIE